VAADLIKRNLATLQSKKTRNEENMALSQFAGDSVITSWMLLSALTAAATGF